MYFICPGSQFTQRKLGDVRYTWHQVFRITRIELSWYLQLQRRYLQLKIEAQIYGAVITLYMVGNTIHVAQTGFCGLYMAPNLQYNAHQYVGISPKAAQVYLDEYWSMNMRSCNYIVYVREHSSHSLNWTMCAIFGTNFAGRSALNCRNILDSSADTFSWILMPEYAEQ
jgi:hypothetical protein